MKKSPVHIVALADIHGVLTYLPAIEDRIRKADAVVVAGDITDFGGAGAAAQVMEAIEAINPHVAAVYGNCDRPEVQSYLSDRGLGVHGEARPIGHLIYAGVGGALVCSGRTPSEVDDAVLMAALDRVGQIPNPGPQPLVLVTHQPPYGTGLDDLSGGVHGGSRAIRAFIEQYRPVLAVSGHFHEVIGVDRIGPTTLLNPGPFKQGCYALVRIDGQGAKVELKTA